MRTVNPASVREAVLLPATAANAPSILKTADLFSAATPSL
jgi:hypothetical protein